VALPYAAGELGLGAGSLTRLDLGYETVGGIGHQFSLGAAAALRPSLLLRLGGGLGVLVAEQLGGVSTHDFGFSDGAWVTPGVRALLSRPSATLRLESDLVIGLVRRELVAVGPDVVETRADVSLRALALGVGCEWPRPKARAWFARARAFVPLDAAFWLAGFVPVVELGALWSL
jgi:hypothetical protein